MSGAVSPIWYLSVLVVATCGLVYELLAATLASYVLGDSITQFSLIIGCYISSMGLGAYLSRFVERHVVRTFLDVQLCIALLGGTSAPLLFVAFGHSHHFHVVLYGIVVGVGVLVGLELPLLMRILRDQLDFKELVSRILTVDYLGGLVASLLFPLFCVPHLGLVRTSLVFGLLNAGVAIWGSIALVDLVRGAHLVRLRAFAVVLLLAAGLVYSEKLTQFAEQATLADPIVYSEQSAHQRIILTRGRAGIALYLNGGLQFASADERRYHEALVHVPMVAQGNPQEVLVLGGGDGLALREVLHWPSVRRVTLVDLDPAMTGLSDHFPPLATLNEHSFADPRVTVLNQDAMVWLSELPRQEAFDVVLVDFPDPNNFALGKLYTKHFYSLLRQHVRPGGAVAVQSTSPLFARTSYWTIVRTLEAAGFGVQPYQVAVPSFGVWGFALARLDAAPPPRTLQGAPSNLHFLNDATLASLFTFGGDTGPVATEINRLDNQALVRTYEHEWRHWN